MADELRDGRRRDFFIVDNAIVDEFGPRIGAAGLAVYAVLARMAGQRGNCWPAVGTVAQRAGVSEAVARRGIQSLRDAGLLSVSGRADQHGAQQANVYTLRPVGQATPETPPETTPNDAPGETVYIRTVGRVAAAEGNGAKTAALRAVFAECFGQEISWEQAGLLAQRAGGHEAAAKECLVVAAKFPPPIANPLGLILSGLAKWKRGANTPKPRPQRELNDLGGNLKRDKTDDPDGLPF